jgi:hypothetical protein
MGISKFGKVIRIDITRVPRRRPEHFHRYHQAG